MAGKHILAFDLGTGGNKAVLYNSQGILLGSTFSPYETFYPQSGWAEQCPLHWWNSLVKTTQALLRLTGVSKAEIACLSISGHGIGVVPVSKDGRLLRERTLLWSDSRAIAQTKEYFRRVDYNRWYSITGAALRPENYAIFKIMWHRDHEPELYRDTYKFIGTKDYLNMKMTGNIVSDFSDASFSGVNDLLGWKYSEEYLKEAGIPADKLPALIPSTGIVGELLPVPADELGLTRGIPVICGGYDGSCTALGAGNYIENRIYNYVGSSSWISVASDKPLIEQRIKPYCYYHVIPGMFNSTVSIYAAGSAYQWVRNVLCREEVFAAGITGVDPYEIMNQEAKQSPVGANNLFFNPSLMGGSTINPSPNLRGAFIGLELGHTKADMLRAVMEGVAYDLRLVLDCFRHLNVQADEVRMVGGGSKSELWRQIFADIYRSKIILTNVGQEAAALGAATLAAIGAGIWKDFSIVDSIARTVHVSVPNPGNEAEYEKRLPVFGFLTEKLAEIGEEISLLRK
ncbi:MAG: FGGY-family carbohydrate kinase [Rectinemataceae bacterium]